MATEPSFTYTWNRCGQLPDVAHGAYPAGWTSLRGAIPITPALLSHRHRDGNTRRTDDVRAPPWHRGRSPSTSLLSSLAAAILALSPRLPPRTGMQAYFCAERMQGQARDARRPGRPRPRQPPSSSGGDVADHGAPTGRGERRGRPRGNPRSHRNASGAADTAVGNWRGPVLRRGGGAGTYCVRPAGRQARRARRTSCGGRQVPTNTGQAYNRRDADRDGLDDTGTRTTRSLSVDTTRAF